MATKAGAWFRVSSGKQDEANQVPDVEQHCSQRGYDITKRYELNDRSAFKGEQDKELAKMLYDMRTGKIQVLVVWHSDRLERRGAEALLKLLREVREAGGKVESVKEPLLGETDISGEASTALAGIMAHQESVKKSERELIAVRRVRDNGGLWGVLPWGYVSAGEKYNRKAEPTEDGRRYIPKMFQRIADGQSLTEVASWLRTGPLPNISPKTVLRMIRNKTYMGQRTDLQGRYIMKVPALVDAALWQRANDRLSNAPRGRRAPASGKPALLTSKLFCLRCGSPMYGKHRVKGDRHYNYYRCHGKEPDLKGCGNMVRMELTEAAAIALLSMAHDDWTELRRFNGESYEAQLADIHIALSDLPKQGLSRQEEQAERERLWAEEDKYTELQERAGKLPKWRQVPICTTCGDSEYTDTCEAAGHHKTTVGEHFSSLDRDGQRKMILDDVKVYAKSLEPEFRKLGVGPMLRIESRLFTLPLQWIEPDGQASESEPESA